MQGQTTIYGTDQLFYDIQLALNNLNDIPAGGHSAIDLNYFNGHTGQLESLANISTAYPNASSVDMNNQKIINLTPGTASTDAVNVSQLSGFVTGKSLSEISGIYPSVASISASNQNITNLATATTNDEATNLGQMNTAISTAISAIDQTQIHSSIGYNNNHIQLTGGNLQTFYLQNGNSQCEFTGVGSDINLQCTTGNLELQSTGNIKLNVPINANNNTIDNLPDPTTNLEAANKEYVDNSISQIVIDNIHDPTNFSRVDASNPSQVTIKTNNINLLTITDNGGSNAQIASNGNMQLYSGTNEVDIFGDSAAQQLALSVQNNYTGTDCISAIQMNNSGQQNCGMFMVSQFATGIPDVSNAFAIQSVSGGNNHATAISSNQVFVDSSLVLYADSIAGTYPIEIQTNRKSGYDGTVTVTEDNQWPTKLYTDSAISANIDANNTSQQALMVSAISNSVANFPYPFDQVLRGNTAICQASSSLLGHTKDIIICANSDSSTSTGNVYLLGANVYWSNSTSTALTGMSNIYPDSYNLTHYYNPTNPFYQNVLPFSASSTGSSYVQFSAANTLGFVLGNSSNSFNISQVVTPVNQPVVFTNSAAYSFLSSQNNFTFSGQRPVTNGSSTEILLTCLNATSDAVGCQIVLQPADLGISTQPVQSLQILSETYNNSGWDCRSIISNGGATISSSIVAHQTYLTPEHDISVSNGNYFLMKSYTYGGSNSNNILNTFTARTGYPSSTTFPSPYNDSEFLTSYMLSSGNFQPKSIGNQSSGNLGQLKWTASNALNFYFSNSSYNSLELSQIGSSTLNFLSPNSSYFQFSAPILLNSGMYNSSSQNYGILLNTSEIEFYMNAQDSLDFNYISTLTNPIKTGSYVQELCNYNDIYICPNYLNSGSATSSNYVLDLSMSTTGLARMGILGKNGSGNSASIIISSLDGTQKSTITSQNNTSLQIQPVNNICDFINAEIKTTYAPTTGSDLINLTFFETYFKKNVYQFLSTSGRSTNGKYTGWSLNQSQVRGSVYPGPVLSVSSDSFTITASTIGQLVSLSVWLVNGQSSAQYNIYPSDVGTSNNSSFGSNSISNQPEVWLSVSSGVLQNQGTQILQMYASSYTFDIYQNNSSGSASQGCRVIMMEL